MIKIELTVPEFNKILEYLVTEKDGKELVIKFTEAYKEWQIDRAREETKKTI